MMLGMDLHEIGTILGLATGLLALLGVAYTIAVRLAKLELKVETIWDFLVRRAFSEAVEKGVADVHSPIALRAEAKELMRPLAPVLQAFYLQSGQKLTDGELMLEIERRFGDEILRLVCLPNRFSSGACLLIAAEVAKEIAGAPPLEPPPQKDPPSGIHYPGKDTYRGRPPAPKDPNAGESMLP